MTLVMGLVGMVGVGEQEAFQLLWNASGIFYALTYLVMFAIPLVGLRKLKDRPSVWLRLASASGFLMTLLYVGLSVFPIVKVDSPLAFAIKITAVIIVANIIGAIIFLLAERRRNATA
jgi:drug/metabolite transporter (DMT)-like permease